MFYRFVRSHTLFWVPLEAALNEVDKSGIVVYFEYVLEYFRARLSQLDAIVLE